MAKRSSMEGSEEEEHGDHPGGFQRVGKVAAGAGPIEITAHDTRKSLKYDEI